MVFSLLVAGGIIAAGAAAYTLWKAGKAITGGSVVAGVKTEVATAVADVTPIVNTEVSKVVNTVVTDVTKTVG